jgi:phosphoribosylformylglycinamidine synthase
VAADIATTLRADHALFSESQSRVVVSTTPAQAAAFASLMAECGVPCQQIGQVTAASEAQLQININGDAAISVPVAQLEKTWKDAIPCLMQ